MRISSFINIRIVCCPCYKSCGRKTRPFRTDLLMIREAMCYHLGTAHAPGSQRWLEISMHRGFPPTQYIFNEILIKDAWKKKNRDTRVESAVRIDFYQKYFLTATKDVTFRRYSGFYRLSKCQTCRIAKFAPSILPIPNNYRRADRRNFTLTCRLTWN